MSIVARTAGVFARGIVAGLVATTAMTVSSTVEAKLRHWAASTAPARAARKVLGIKQFNSPDAEQTFSTLVHWSYGTGWGVARSLLGSLGLRATLAAPVHFAAMWGGALVALPALDVVPPVRKWGRTELAIDLFHHLVYAVAAGLSYQALNRRTS
jgi:hypothetical protein